MEGPAGVVWRDPLVRRQGRAAKDNSGKRLVQAVARKLSAVDIVFAKSDGALSRNRRPLAKVRQGGDGRLEVVWSNAHLAAGLDKKAVLEELARSRRAGAVAFTSYSGSQEDASARARETRGRF